MEPSFVPATALLCDFCNDPSVVRSYAAAPVVLKVDDIALYFCDSKWAACSTCSQLIDENRWDELSNRSFSLWVTCACLRGERHSDLEEQRMKAHLIHMHALFREARRRTA